MILLQLCVDSLLLQESYFACPLEVDPVHHAPPFSRHVVPTDHLHRRPVAQLAGRARVAADHRHGQRLEGHSGVGGAGHVARRLHSEGGGFFWLLKPLNNRNVRRNLRNCSIRGFELAVSVWRWELVL